MKFGGNLDHQKYLKTKNSKVLYWYMHKHGGKKSTLHKGLALISFIDFFCAILRFQIYMSGPLGALLTAYVNVSLQLILTHPPRLI